MGGTLPSEVFEGIRGGSAEKVLEGMAFQMRMAKECWTMSTRECGTCCRASSVL